MELVVLVKYCFMHMHMHAQRASRNLEPNAKGELKVGEWGNAERGRGTWSEVLVIEAERKASRGSCLGVPMRRVFRFGSSLPLWVVNASKHPSRVYSYRLHSFISFDLAGVGSEDDRLNYSVLDSSPNCCTYVGFCRLGWTQWMGKMDLSHAFYSANNLILDDAEVQLAIKMHDRVWIRKLF